MAKKETTKKNTTEKKVTKKATTKAAKTTKKKEVVEEKQEVLEVPTVQVVNGDPAVLEPVGQAEFISTEEPEGPYSIDPVTEELKPAEPLREKQKVIKPAKKKDEEENPHEFTSLVAEEIVNEPQPEEYDSAKPAKKKAENNHKPNKIRKILGYFWNGQEFDY